MKTAENAASKEKVDPTYTETMNTNANSMNNLQPRVITERLSQNAL